MPVMSPNWVDIESGQLIQDTVPFDIIKQRMITESKDGVRIKGMRLTGVFQRADELNANNRIYPLSILGEAVEALQPAIKERRVFGEWDHPCLTTFDFRVLTVDGWKEFKDIKIGDKVYSRINGNMVESTVINIIDEAYSGSVYNLKGKHIDVTYTPPHKMILDSRSDYGQVEQVETTIHEIYTNRKKWNKYSIPRTMPVVEYAVAEVGGEILNNRKLISESNDIDDVLVADLNITKNYYNGNIYCLTTEHGNFYMEHKGHSFWTGNCDAKIHLDRICHLVTKVWIEGKVAYGEIEVFDDIRCPHGAMLSLLIERKANIGISSRGVGDMEITRLAEGEEAYMVSNGYRIVTFDAVAEPSVTGTQLFMMESKNRVIGNKKTFVGKDLVREIKNYLNRS